LKPRKWKQYNEERKQMKEKEEAANSKRKSDFSAVMPKNESGHKSIENILGLFP